MAACTRAAQDKPGAPGKPDGCATNADAVMRFFGNGIQCKEPAKPSLKERLSYWLHLSLDLSQH